MSKKHAILLINLGSPNSTSEQDVRSYLKEFLGDERVIDIPFVRKVIIPGLVLRTRPKQSAEAYAKVWTDEGSPLLVLSKQQQKALQERCDSKVYLAMRYGEPSIESILEQMQSDGVEEFLLMPLYPHYAMSSYETVVVEVSDQIKNKQLNLSYELLQPFYNEDAYIDALIKRAKPYMDEGFDQLLFSFHGLPERHLKKSDPSHAHCLQVPNCCEIKHPAHSTCYRHQCFATVKAFTEKTGLNKDQYSVSFQSRLLKDPWLKPFTDQLVDEFAKNGMKKLLVICPAFVADCLETIEEIGMEANKQFRELGGESFQLIPCLNDSTDFIDFLQSHVKKWEESLSK